MKISARNVIEGKVIEVRKGATTAHVRLDIGGSVNITKEIVAYAKVDNVFDTAPARTNIFSNPALYDGLGRIYRAGVRFRF